LLAFLARRRAVVGVVGLALVAPAFVWSLKTTWMHTIGFTMLYVGYGAVIMLAVTSERAMPEPLGSLAFVGQHSYSIYLWHRVVLVSMRQALEQALGYRMPFAIEVVLMTTGAIALGVAMGKLVEMPAMRLRDRWFPRPTEARFSVVAHSAKQRS
jgi:peptidoglycan/LPS O-acetylase OafA/YrhL